ncbi:hypothetical protein AVANS14531_03925 [Campylobacter sp. Cr9]|uniref:rhamnan synthesis F family protein n=1 Tax=Campylobacter sp. Cr9 TaxID=2735728 RepID=UPI0030145283|nr:hypothetical protein [Campylobacter sp. Cr9]
MSNRIAIYVFYEKNGEVRDYVTYCINGLKEVARDILVIVNGSINDDGLQKLKDLNVEVLQRENIGFDFAAYKAGIEHIGYDKLKNYDELILTNNSYYGPIYPFSEMFDEMAKRECDFWGINRHPKTNDSIKVNKKKYYIKEHIQSYFLVFRKSLLESDDFKRYWDNLKVFLSFSEAIAYGECELTYYFEQQGFSSSVYINFIKYSELINNNPTILIYEQVVIDKCPIIKRKSFSEYKHVLYNFSVVPNTSSILNNIKQVNAKLYDCVWDDLLALYSLDELGYLINLYDIISDKYIHSNGLKNKNALFIYIHDEYIKTKYVNLINSIFNYLDIILICNKNDFNQQFVNYDEKIIFNAEVIYEKIMSYDHVCFIHDMDFYDIIENIQTCIKKDFAEITIQALLYNKLYIANIINKLYNDARLGMYIPMMVPHFHFNQFVLSAYMSNGYCDDKIIITNNMFWIKTKVLGNSFDAFRRFLNLFKIGDVNSGKILVNIVQDERYYIKYCAPLELANAYIFKLFNISQSYMFYVKYFNYFKYCFYKILSPFIKSYKTKRLFLKKIRNDLRLYFRKECR